MPRRKRDSALDDAFEVFKLTPFWVGPVVALAAFWFIRSVMPTFFRPAENGVDVGILFRKACPMFAWFALIGIMLAWVAAEASKFKDRRLFDRQTGIDSVRKLSWRDFEHLVGEYYRRHGYLAEVVGTNGNDGGVDIVLSGHGARVLVQCKQWKAYKVGVQPVRELLGVVVSQKANRGILVTSGRFTNEAHAFAVQNRTIELIDGVRLEQMISSVTSGGMISSPPSKPFPPPLASKPSSPSCPTCGAGMVLRTARRGQNAGSQFWGCTTYPRCGGTVALK